MIMNTKSKLWIIYSLIALILIAAIALIILVTSVNAATFSDPSNNFKGDAVYGPNNQTVTVTETSSSNQTFPWPSWVTWSIIIIAGLIVTQKMVRNIVWSYDGV